MKLNLNVSKELGKMTSENTSSISSLSSGVGFEDIIASLDLDDENNSNDVMDLIQNLLSSINLFKEINNNDNNSLKKEEILNEINSIIAKINNQDIDLDFNIDNILENDLDVNSEDIEANILNIDKLNTKTMSKKPEEKTIKTEKIAETENTTKMVEKLDDEVKSLKSYEELNVSTNINKNNVVDTKPKSNDEDLNILENILDDNSSAFSTVVNKTFIQESSANKNLPVVTIRANHMADDFIKMVKYLKNNNIEEIKVNINPKELGDMTIKLMKDSEATKLIINVGKEDTYNMLNKNISDINKHLSDLGIKVKDIAVTMKSNDEKLLSDNLNKQFNKKEEQKGKKRNNQKQVSSIEDIEEIENSNLNFNILT